MSAARDLYYAVTHSDGKVSVNVTRVWDADKHIASLAEQHAKEGNFVREATREDYQRANWRPA